MSVEFYDDAGFGCSAKDSRTAIYSVKILIRSVAEPPLFWAAPVRKSEVPELTPAPTKLGRLRLQTKRGGSGPIH